MAVSATQITLFCIVSILILARPVKAFGAGNIGSTSEIEGQNWRHGDLEDTLLTLVASRAMGGKKFGKLDVKRIYFGNWLRDYSQAVDVGTVKHVSAEAIRILLWILGFMSFGYGTKEFEVTTERLGCYRPEEHIDNPRDYADNEDARQYDRRLRGPVDERRELAIDPETGMKSYIASENLRITTSAGLVRNLFGRSIELGRRYARNKNKADLYEALRLLGTGCHCLEDFSAHSNYTELALIELGERDIFPHVGRNTQVRLRGARNPVFPIVTGTFGGVDFLHSVTGEFDDKVTQSEIQELEGTLQQAQNQQQNTSLLQDLLRKVPGGVFGGKDQAGKADELKMNAAQHQMQNSRVSPRQPEEWTQYLNDVQKQIYPIIEWHDEVMQSITETIEKIPILPDLIEQIQEQVNVLVFSLLAPFVLPIINQVKSELNTGSSAIIQSSKDKQHIVFKDDNSTDPTHSMLSKDHFSNVLNEPAGKIAGQVLRWAVPQIIACWDDERIDVERTLNRIIRGVLHHPVMREQGDDGASDGRRLMFGVVEKWWREKDQREKDELRQQLNRRGVESGRNHKPGVQDHGHGSGKKLGMPNVYSGPGSSGPLGNLGGLASGLTGIMGGPSSGAGNNFGQIAGEAVGGGALGGLVGGLASAIGGDILGGGMGGDNSQTYKRQSYGNDGSRTETITQVGASGNRYGQAQYSRTEDRYGGTHQEYDRYEQHNNSGRLQSEVHHEEVSSYGGNTSETHRYGGDSDSRFGRQQEYGGSHGRQEQGYGRNDHQSSYGQTAQQFNRSGASDGRESYGHQGLRYTGGYESQQDNNAHNRQDYTSSYDGGFGRRNDETTYGSGRHQEDSSSFGTGYGRQQTPSGYGGGYGRQEEVSSYGSNFSRQQETSAYDGEYGRQQQTSGRYGQRENDQPSYGSERRQQSAEYGSGGYGQQQQSEHNRHDGNTRRQKDDSDSDDEKKNRRRHKKKDDSDSDDDRRQRRRSNDSDNDNRRYGVGDNENRKYASGNYGGEGGYGGGGYGGDSYQGGNNEGYDRYQQADSSGYDY